MKERGYSTIADLAGHRRFSRPARETLAILTGTDVPAIERIVSRWLAPSHHFSFLTAGFYHPRDLLFIDIETLGLFSRPIILFGLAEIRSGELCISQYLLRDISEEVPALSAVFDQSGRRPGTDQLQRESVRYPVPCRTVGILRQAGCYRKSPL